jgi:EAL domain-containing protein (putative c-di-GMP-specific phosphodiesterase class I)
MLSQNRIFALERFAPHFNTPRRPVRLRSHWGRRFGDRSAPMGTLAGQSATPAVISDLFAQGLKGNGVNRLLRTVRKHLGMDVAFVSQFRERDRVMEHVDAEGTPIIQAGQVIPLEEGYCQKVALGQLPELIPDTALVPDAMAIPETHAIPIGAHLSVPIRLQGGRVYGTLCCFSHLPDLSLRERDLNMLRAFAEVLASQIDELSLTSERREAKVAAVRRAMAEASPKIVYQPIYSLSSGAITGVECLSRFDGQPSALSPIQWFDLADEVGLREELEIAAIRRALQTLDNFPTWVYFGLNSSPQTILSGALARALQGFDLRRIVIEITEHAIVPDYLPLNEALQPLRAQGLRVAIDDAGAGYASMRHIVNLLPDYIKLDMSLTRRIDTDPTRRALAKALVSFSREIGSLIIAEGIETEAELNLLRSLGVGTGQGYLLAEPVPLNMACHPDTHKRELRTEQIQLSL